MEHDLNLNVTSTTSNKYLPKKPGINIAPHHNHSEKAQDTPISTIYIYINIFTY